GDQLDTTPAEKVFDHEGVASNVVLAQQVDLELLFVSQFVQADHVLEELVVGDVMSGRLTDAAIAFATEPEDVDAEFFLHLTSDGVHVVSNQPDRTRRKDGNRLGMEGFIGLLDRRLEFLLATEDDLLFRHVRGETVVDEVRIRVGGRTRLVAPRQPTIERAANRSMRNAKNVAAGADHDAFATGIGASPLRNNPRAGANVGLDLRNRAVRAHFRNYDLLGPFFPQLLRINRHHF